MSSGSGYIISAQEEARRHKEEERRRREIAEAERRRKAAEVLSLKREFKQVLLERSGLLGVAAGLEVAVWAEPEWPGDASVGSAKAAVREAKQSKAYLEEQIEQARACLERDRGRIAAAVAKRQRLESEAAELRLTDVPEFMVGKSGKPSAAQASAQFAESANKVFSDRLAQERKALSLVHGEIARDAGKRDRLIVEAKKMGCASSKAPTVEYLGVSCLEEARRQLDDMAADTALITGQLGDAYRKQSLDEADQVWAAIKPVAPGVDVWVANEPWRNALRSELRGMVDELGLGQSLPDEVSLAMDTVESAVSERLAVESVRLARRAAESMLFRMRRVESIRSELDRIGTDVEAVPSAAIVEKFSRLCTDFDGHDDLWLDDELSDWLSVRLPGLRRDIDVKRESDVKAKQEAIDLLKKELAETVVGLACQSLDGGPYEIVGTVGLNKTAGLEEFPVLDHASAYVPSGVGFIARRKGDQSFAILGRATTDGHFEFIHADINMGQGVKVDDSAHRVACDHIKEVIRDVVEPYIQDSIEAGYSVEIGVTEDRGEIWVPSTDEKNRMINADTASSISTSSDETPTAKTMN